MKIVIGTVGSRGDVQPCLALGVALKAAGFEVSVATHPDYDASVRARGLEFRPVGSSFREMTRSDLGRQWLESGNNPIRYARLLERLLSPVLQRLNEDADAAVEGHDAVLYYPLAVQFLQAAERRRLPIVAIPFYPFVPTGEIAPVILPPRLPVGSRIRRLAWDLMHAFLLRPFHPSLFAHRERIGLSPIRTSGLTSHAFSLGIPHVHIMSPTLIPRPADWPGWATVTGACFLDEPAYQPPPELEAFLSSGRPPIYVGFGSMTGTRPEALGEIVRESVALAGERAVVAGGWGALELRGDDRCFVIDEVPHDWLFSRVSAVVHHGGVGTTTAGLRAGRASIVVPFFGDQPHWGERIRQLGAGPAPIPRAELTPRRLARSLREVRENERFARRAKELATHVVQEDGLKKTVEAVARLLDRPA